MEDVRSSPGQLPITKLEVIRADITTLNVDAIVNAANAELAPGAGVCGAIHAAAGPELARECRKLGHCETGEAVVTGAHGLRSVKAIIHAVGPVYSGDPERSRALLASTYRAVLDRCAENGLRSVAIPCISTGIYGYPKRDAAEIAVSTVRGHLTKTSALERVIFCCFGEDDAAIYRSLLSQRAFER